MPPPAPHAFASPSKVGAPGRREGPAQGGQKSGPVWVGGTVFAVARVYLLNWFGLGALLSHLQLTLSWPQSPAPLSTCSSTFSSCFLRRTPSVPMATDPASVPSPTPREVEAWGPLEPPSYTPYTGGWALGSGITQLRLAAGRQRTLSLIWGLGFPLSLHAQPPPEPCPPVCLPGDTACPSMPEELNLPSPWGGGWLRCPPWKLRTWVGPPLRI